MKASKEKANYREGTKKRHCGICFMFRPPHGCTAVEGKIEKPYVCNYFKLKNKAPDNWKS